MILYEKDVKKSVKKGIIPKDVFRRFNNAFIALDNTKDLGLFDIKKLKSSEKRTYYCLRKGKYRAIFYIENEDYYVISIAKREEVYQLWE
jgi:mRNA interferase RelE/StbE